MEFGGDNQDQGDGAIQLKRIAGFFAIQLSLLHNLPQLFSMEYLREMWNDTHVAIQKGLDLAMHRCELDEMLKLKQAMLLFCLCV